MKKTYTLGLGMLITLFSAQTIAQERVIVDDNYSRNSRNYRQKKERFTFLKNYQDNPLNETVLKFNPFQLFRGEIGIGAEQVFGERVTGVLTVGPTISNLSPFSAGHTFPQANGFVQPQPAEQSAVGFMSAVAFRYYPMNDDAATDGFFIEPQFKFRRYNSNIIDRQEILNPVKGSLTEARFAFNMGVQRWYSNNFSLEFYAGAGILSDVDRTSRVFSGFDEQTFETFYYWQDSEVRNAKWFISGGINIGIGWSKQ